MEFAASSLTARSWPLDANLGEYGEEVADIDDVTVEFDETSGVLSASGRGGSAQGQTSRGRLSPASVVMTWCDLETKPTLWIMYGVSEEDAESYRQAHFRWAEG
jgi:hypothetical protein